MTTRERNGVLAILGANIIFGVSFIATRMVFDAGMTIFGLLFWRFALASLVLSLLYKAKVLKLNLTFKRWLALFPLAVCDPIIYYIGESIGIAKTGSAISGTLIAMIPIATLISARLFLKEKHTLLQVLAVVVSVGGVVLIAFTGADGNFAAEPMGYLLLLVAVLAAAAYQILVKFKDNLYTAMEMVFGIALYGLIFYGSCGIIEAAVTNNFYRLILLPFDQPLVLLLVIALAMVSTIGAFCLFNYAISAIGPTRCSVFAGVMSVTSIICGIVVLDEVLSISQLCGALMVILGAWAANHFIYRETAEDQVEKISAPNKDEMRVG